MSLAPDPLAGDLVAALRAAGLADVDDSRLARTLYSSDASVYRLEPRVVTGVLDEQPAPAGRQVGRAAQDLGDAVVDALARDRAVGQDRGHRIGGLGQ
jgi:hypothetical protein